MNCVELRKKILDQALCRLCLSENYVELTRFDIESNETNQTPKEIIEKFNLIELSIDIELKTICKPCLCKLDSFNKFHLIAKASDDEIRKALDPKNEEIEFLIVNDCEDDGLSLWNEDNHEELQCNFCSKSYKRKSYLERHIEKQHRDGKVKIRRKLQSKVSYKLNDHDKAHQTQSFDVPESRQVIFDNVVEHPDNLNTRERQHSCPICYKTFCTVSNRNSHLQTHNSNNSVICSECKQGFKSILYLKKHQKAIHTKIENICNVCDRKFFCSQQKFDYHLKTHDTVKRYKCNFAGCDKSFMQFHHLENHKTTHTGVSKYLCFKCGKEFRQECNLKAHLRIHDDDHEKSFTCSFTNCGKTFKSSTSFRCHKNTHENNSKSNQCPECSKKFSQRSSLRAHFQTHFRDPSNRPYKCNQPGCDRTFYQERSIKYHQSTAHGIGDPIIKKTAHSEFVCDYCQKAFTLQSLLKRHIFTHLEEEQINRKHKCHECEASFKRPEHLKLHTNAVHLKYKPHKCEYQGCNKSFAQIGDRNVHMKVHSNERLHVCLTCQKAFRLAKGLRAHEKTHLTKKKNKNMKNVFSSHEPVTIFHHPVPQESQVVFLLASMTD